MRPCPPSSPPSSVQTVRALFVHALVSVLTFTWLASLAAAQVTRLSVSNAGIEANGFSNVIDISRNGRWVVIESWATNLVVGVPDGHNYYLVDLSNRTIRHLPGLTLKQRGGRGELGVGDTSRPYASISDDGNTLVSGSLIYDVAQASASSISAARLPPLTGGDTSVNSVAGAVASPNNRFLAFASDQRWADQYDSYRRYRALLVRDRSTGNEVCAAAVPVTAPFGGELFLSTNVEHPELSVSDDGQRVTFFGTAQPLAQGVSADTLGPYTLECATGEVTLAMARDLGLLGVFAGFSRNARYVASIECGASLVVNVFDTVTRTNSAVALNGAQSCASANAAYVTEVSDDGRYILAVLDPVSSARRVWVDTSRRTLKTVAPRSGSPFVGRFTMSGDGRYVVFASGEADLVAGDTNGEADVFVRDMFDDDGDGMTDEWETAFGLNPENAADAALDPDGDGATSLQEFVSHTHPRGLSSATRYFAEGARSAFFRTEFSIANPTTTAAAVLLRYAAPDGQVAYTTVNVPARASRKVQVPDLAFSEFATRVETDVPVVVDRVLSWTPSEGYGTHGEHAVTAPATTWYFAEGATHSGFDLFYLLYNPSDTAAEVRVRYLRPSAQLLEKTYVVGPGQRFNVWVNLEIFGGATRLAAADVSARIDVLNGVPIIAERAMYRTTPGANASLPGVLFEAGHESAGVTARAASWLFAEGATGDFFDLFMLLANSEPEWATVRGTYLLADGRTFTKTYEVPPQSRFTIWVDLESFDGISGTPLANVGAVSTTFDVLNGPDIVAERSLWWPGPTAATWTEAHNSPGATTTATRWVAAAGVVSDGPSADATYYLVANPGNLPATVGVTLLFADGTPELTRTFVVGATSRFTLDVRAEFPTAIGRGFSALVETDQSTPVVVEWALYRDALGKMWAGGANALATPLP